MEMTVMLKVGTRFKRFSDAGTHARRGYPGATPGRLLGALVLVVGDVCLGAGQDAGVLDARRSFAPPGWEIGDCPPASGSVVRWTSPV
ncbi:MAG: hypothetical protein ACXU88_17165, partial [Myxococcaceae bacterium]